MQSMRQTELQEIGWDNRHGGRMDEWSSKSPCNKGTEHMPAGNKNSQSLLSAMYITERSLRTEFYCLHT